PAGPLERRGTQAAHPEARRPVAPLPPVRDGAAGGDILVPAPFERGPPRIRRIQVLRQAPARVSANSYPEFPAWRADARGFRRRTDDERGSLDWRGARGSPGGPQGLGLRDPHRRHGIAGPYQRDRAFDR